MRKALLLILSFFPFWLLSQEAKFKVVCNSPILHDTLEISISPGDKLQHFNLYINGRLADDRPVYSYDPYMVSYCVTDTTYHLRPWEENVRLKLTLTDTDNVTEEQELTVTYLSLSRQAHKDALLIANNEYKSRNWRSLSAPIGETKRLSQLLHDQFGFQTKVITNASRKEIISALYELSRKSSGYDNPYDQLVVYYSGHGEYDSVFNTGYIVPTDGTSEIESYISYLDIGQILNSIHYNHVLFISDACFSGTFFLHNTDLGDTRDEVRSLSSTRSGIRESQMSRSRLAITSTSPALESPAKSDLAASLLRILSDPYDNFIDFAELKSALTVTSEGEAASPIHCKGFGNNAIQGTFLFIRSRKYLDSLSRHDGESCGTVKDYDGNEYTTTRLGHQCWIREDMHTTHYSDGTPIPLVDYRTIPFKYGSSVDSIPPFPKDQLWTLKDSVFAPMMFQVPNRDEAGSPMVTMYNWPAATRSDFTGPIETCEKLQGICPDGWHLPSDCEWQALQTHLETSVKRYYPNDNRVENPHRYIAKSLAAKKQWRGSTNKYAVGKSLKDNDSTHMSMLPAGAIGWKYGVSNNYADFWSSTRKEPFGEDICRHVCGYFYLSTDDREVWTGTAEHFVGMCVRCVKDETIEK